ncbi:hypothetical protein PybrP1_006249 [[Pythium] brassicae (nom. inval.)]|nr:hypothetical protein PybrP1_006249 [[Pythium] brassicae (nom. inval.)]
MWLLLVTALLAAESHVATAESQLRQVIVLSRHGVRGPYGLGEELPTRATLEKYALNPHLQLPLDAASWGTGESGGDPAEPVSPKLTKHGYSVVKLMGDYFRAHLYADFLDASCDKTFSYADANQRDNLTAQAFLSGLHPTCKDVVPITAQTRLLFEQGQDPSASCPVCSRTVYEGITGANDTRYLVQEIHDEIVQIDDLLQCCAPSVCAAGEERASDADEEGDEDDDSESRSGSTGANKTCGLFGVPSKWNGAFYEPWLDTMSAANYFSEFWLLQSLNNMTLPLNVTFEQILKLSRAHMDLITNEVNAASFGATLLAHLTASFEQSSTGAPVPTAEGDGPHLLQPPDNRFLYYAAHDINLLYVRRLLRLEWHAKGWHPHQPVPGSMLVFELHSSLDERVVSVKTLRRLSAAAAKHFVKLYFVAASPEQMRHGHALSDRNPPDRVPVTIPGCSEDVVLPSGAVDVRCSFLTFKKLLGKSLKHECVAPTLQPFVDSLLLRAAQDAGAATSERDALLALPVLVWVVFGALVLAFVALALRHAVLKRRARASSTQKREYGTLPQITSE